MSARWWINFMCRLVQMNKGSTSIYHGQRLVLDWSVSWVMNLSNKGSHLQRQEYVIVPDWWMLTSCGLRFWCENVMGKKFIVSWNFHFLQTGNSLSGKCIKRATYYVYHMGKMFQSPFMIPTKCTFIISTHMLYINT